MEMRQVLEQEADALASCQFVHLDEPGPEACSSFLTLLPQALRIGCASKGFVDISEMFPTASDDSNRPAFLDACIGALNAQPSTRQQLTDSVDINFMVFGFDVDVENVDNVIACFVADAAARALLFRPLLLHCRAIMTRDPSARAPETKRLKTLLETSLDSLPDDCVEARPRS
eukprot:COSAG06_NODE_5932_length_3203_cov_5.976804_1_plen_173_part_00